MEVPFAAEEASLALASLSSASRDSVRQKKKKIPYGEERPGAGHYVREGASVFFSFFFAGNADGRRGWAAAVALTRVAQLGNRGERTSRRRRRRRRGSSRERDRGEHSRAHGYLYIFCFSNLHVSPRVSSLFRAQHSCGIAVSFTPLPSHPSCLASPDFFFSFLFLRIIVTMARKQTHNPLVTHRG